MNTRGRPPPGGQAEEFYNDYTEADDCIVNPVSYEDEMREMSRNSMRFFDGNASGVLPADYHSQDPRLVSATHSVAQSLDNSSIATEDTSRDPTKLYTIVESALIALEEYQNLGGAVNVAESARRREMLENTWEAVREWIVANPSAKDRHEAAVYQGMFTTTALHVVCKLPDPPEAIIHGLIDCAQETVQWPDSNGWLPLHHACANGASGYVLDILAQAYPESKIAQDKRMRTPLHFAFFRHDIRGDADESSVDDKLGVAVEGFIHFLSDSGAAELPDENGMLPLHYACAYGTNTSVLETLVDAYPPSLFVRESKGRTPLHLAMVNAHRIASPSVLRFLLNIPGVNIVDMTDREGNLPLHLLSNISGRLGSDQKDAQHNATECLKIYLKAKPKATADFLTALQSLPEWLRDDAVTSAHVQEILNEKIANRFPTSILLLDGYMLILIIVCFEIATREHIDYRYGAVTEVSNATVIATFFGGAYFLLRECAQVFSMLSLGTFRSWLLDATNWLDMIVIVLVFYYGAAMIDSGYNSNNSFRTGVAVTKAALWMAMISFLKSTMVDFAVFVETVLYVTRYLLFFMIALGVILVAFAEMFLIVYSKTSLCSPNELNDFTVDFPHCTFRSSLLKVYTMMMGEINGENRYETSRVAQFLYIAFAFLVVILLSNVLIAIVTDSHSIIKNERATMVFWSNRLDFVAEMDAISSVREKLVCCFLFKRAPSSSEGNPEMSNLHIASSVSQSGATTAPQSDRDVALTEKKKKKCLRTLWKNLMLLFDSKNYQEMDLHPGVFEFWLYFFLRVIAVCFIIPAWIVLGVVTAGWLWPPQIREWLFIQHRTTAISSTTDLVNETHIEINQLKNEMKDLRAEFKGELKQERREIGNMRYEIDMVQNDVIADVLQVKDIMTTLLDLCRNQQQDREDQAFALATAAARQRR